MMVFVSQLICLLVLIILGVYLIKKYPLHFQLKQMTLVSLFIVMALVLSYFSIMIPLFGFPSLKITLSTIPLMCIGVVFGPTYAFLAGLLYDVLGLIVTPTTFPYLGFTLNSVLAGVIPGLWYKHSFHSKQILRFVNIISFIGVVLFLAYLWTYTKTATFISKYMELTNINKLTISCVFVTFVIFVVYLLNRWILAKQDDEMCNWLCNVVIVEVFLHLCLNPLWLEIMYQMPYLVNFFIRMIKTVIVIPSFTIIGLPIIKAVKRLAKGM